MKTATAAQRARFVAEMKKRGHADPFGEIKTTIAAHAKKSHPAIAAGSKGKNAMARRRHATATVRKAGSNTIVVSAPAPIARRSGGRVRHYYGRARSGVRRAAASRAGRAVSSEKHTMLALAAAGGYGLAVKSGVQIPTIGPLGPAATVGLAAWLYGRMAKNNTASHLATGLLSIALYSWAATGTIAGDDGTAAAFDVDE